MGKRMNTGRDTAADLLGLLPLHSEEVAGEDSARGRETGAQAVRKPMAEAEDTREPDPALGVVGLSKLGQLSALMGVRVIDVKRFENPPVRWSIILAAQPETYVAVHSSRFRSAGKLNSTLWLWGRDPGLPSLNALLGRKILRLMHEIVEENEQ